MNKFFFNSKSRDVAPGKGVNESLENPKDFDDLKNIKDWRKILSNFYVERFVYNSHTYNSVEHAFQAVKIALVDKDKAFWFTIESGNEIGLGSGDVAQKNRKLIKLSKIQLDEWDKIKYNVMINITKERVKQSETYQKVLRETKNAELWHIRVRKSSIRNKYLEDIRSEYFL
jgi:predicted NAD-dependent protein-ADP-ribosyltransferase YbiA (DUF1768 family)